MEEKCVRRGLEKFGFDQVAQSEPSAKVALVFSVGLMGRLMVPSSLAADDRMEEREAERGEHVALQYLA